MAKYQLDIPHNLPVPEVRSRLKAAGPKIESSYGAQISWQGDDRLTVKRKGLEALVQVEAARLHIDLELGFFFSPMAGAIRAGITRQLSELLTGPPPPGGPGPT